MTITYLLHLVIFKAAVVHFTNEIRFRERVTILDWFRSLELERTAQSIIRILFIYMIVTLISLLVFYLLFYFGFRVVLITENPIFYDDFLSLPSAWSLTIITLISTTLLLLVLARFWLAVPNAILDDDGPLVSFRSSAEKVKGHTATVFLILCSFFLPCMAMSLIALNWVHATMEISLTIVLFAITLTSLFDAVAVTVCHHKLSCE